MEASSVGLDVGHSAVKVATAAGRAIFPTAVIPAFVLHDELAAQKARRDTIKIGDESFFVGDTAVIQGRLTSNPGLYEDWVDSAEHAALLLAGFRRAQELGASNDSLVVLGLPAGLYSRQRDKLRDDASRLLQTRVVVMPQPVGPFSLHMLDERGRLKSAHAMDHESWAVIEVGYFTTDFTLIRQGSWIEDKSVSCSGVRVATERLQRILSSKGIAATLFECEEVLRERRLIEFGRTVDMAAEVEQAQQPLVAEIFDTAHRLFAADARRLDGIIITGGGAPLVFSSLKARWPNAVQPSEPRFSVAEGMRRYGDFKLWVEAQEASAGA